MIVRAARKVQKSAQFGVTDEQLATMISEQEKNLKADDENWTEWLNEVRRCLKRAGVFTGNVSNGSGSATRPGLPPDADAGLSMTPVNAPMTPARRQAIVDQLSQRNLTGREHAALTARGQNARLGLDSTGYAGDYSVSPTGPQEKQADAIATMPEERRQAILKELSKNSGMEVDGFTPAERDEAEALIARAGSLQRGRDLPKLAAAVRDVSAVLEGKKAKSDGLLDRLRAQIEEADWKRRGLSAPE